MNIFRDRITIVTGGASGIGRALCEGLAGYGAAVTVADIDGPGAKAVADGIVAQGGRAEPAALDVSDRDAFAGLVDAVAARHGRLDYLFNNAGISLGGEVRDMTPEQWRRIIDVNLMGVLNGTTAAYGVMLGQGAGHIVNIASYLGLVSPPLTAAYNMTKFAVVGLSRSLRHEAAGLGVKVSTVCPGYIRTNLIERGTMLRVSPADIIDMIPFRLLRVEKAVRPILKGVARNRELIVFPFHARLLWRLYRAAPSALAPIFRSSVEKFRVKRGGKIRK